MAKIRITKLFSFEMAHALLGYEGKCRNIHGHSYHLQVTVEGEMCREAGATHDGMLMDFSTLKELVQTAVVSHYDHSLVLSNLTNAQLATALKEHYDKVIIVDFQPTTENLLADFAHRIMASLPSEQKLYSIRLAETETSFAEWINE